MGMTVRLMLLKNTFWDCTIAVMISRVMDASGRCGMYNIESVWSVFCPLGFRFMMKASSNSRASVTAHSTTSALDVAELMESFTFIGMS